MNIYTYKNNGFCNGVNAAYEAALRAKGNRVFTYGEIVHNKRVVASLAEKGVKCVHSLDGLEKGDTLVVRAHGAPKSLFDECEKRGINVIDATCPFVAKIHKIAASVQQGELLVVIGYVVLFKNRVGERTFSELIRVTYYTFCNIICFGDATIVIKHTAI